MTPAERRLLIDSMLEGEITEADFLRLEAELSVDPTVRREYYERVALSVFLRAEAGAAAPPELAAVEKISPVSARRWRGAFLGLAFTVLSLLAVIVWSGNPLGNFAGQSPHDGTHIASGSVEHQASGFAVLSGQKTAVWQDGKRLENGSLLPTGRLNLVSGLVELELFSGVVLVLEGGVEFEIHSPMEMTVARGKVRAHVPAPAQGFRIHTSEGEVVDLGTEFAISVADGRSEVHVLDGEVEWRPRAQDMQRMKKGEAGRWSVDGRESEFAAREQDFVGPAEFREQMKSALNAKRDTWQKSRETLRRDPRLVALYEMKLKDDSNRQLLNQVLDREDIPGAGAVVATSRATDRWGQPGGALDFNPTGSRVRLSIPGEYGSVTLLCWVKINSLDRWYNSLFLTDGHDLHEPHWQIMDDGRIFFSVKKHDQFDRSRGEKDKHVYYSPPFWKGELSGQWLMIATVYDIKSRQVSHYLNGEVLSQERIPEEYLVESVRIGNASIGNWGLPERAEPRFAVRNLNGSMDEFALFSAALSATDIRELYEIGKP